MENAFFSTKLRAFKTISSWITCIVTENYGRRAALEQY